jgi:hypothetical protein
MVPREVAARRTGAAGYIAGQAACRAACLGLLLRAQVQGARPVQ